MTYPYSAQKADELELKEGEIIIVATNPAPEGGWSFGRLGTESGWFPDDFVTAIDEDEVKQFIIKQQLQIARKSTLASSSGSAGSGGASSPSTPSLSKQAAMAEMALLQQELKELEHQRTLLQQEVHRERETRSRCLRLAKADLAAGLLPFPNSLFAPQCSIDGPDSAFSLSFSSDVFARDLLRCCTRLATSIDADAALQAELAPQLLETLSRLPSELQVVFVKEDKWLERVCSAVREVSNPLVHMSANTDAGPLQALSDLLLILSQQLGFEKAALLLRSDSNSHVVSDPAAVSPRKASSVKKRTKKDKARTDKDKSKDKDKKKSSSATTSAAT